MLYKLAQLSKAAPPISVIDDGNSISWSFSQPAKAQSPIEDTELGINILLMTAFSNA